MVVLSWGHLFPGHSHCHCSFPACVSSALLRVVWPPRSVVIERTHIGPWPGPWLLGSHLCPLSASCQSCACLSPFVISASQPPQLGSYSLVTSWVFRNRVRYAPFSQRQREGGEAGERVSRRRRADGWAGQGVILHIGFYILMVSPPGKKC